MASLPPDEAPSVPQELLDGLSRSSVKSNLSQQILIITEDWAELCLTHHRDALRDVDSWMAPFGVLVTLGLTMVTSDFHSFLGVSAEVVKAFFIFSALGTAAWFAYSLFRTLRAYRTSGIRTVIEALGTRKSHK